MIIECLKKHLYGKKYREYKEAYYLGVRDSIISMIGKRMANEVTNVEIESFCQEKFKYAKPEILELIKKFE